jgi:heterodisulfide reductase subunit C
MISMRQQLASQLDPSNPESYMKVAQFAAQSGDQQFATAIANAGRQAAVQVAQANKERQLAVPADIQKAQMIPQIEDALEQYKTLPQSPERDRAIRILESQLNVLNPKKVEAVADKLQIARRVSELESQLSPDTGVVLPPQVRAGLQAELNNLKTQQKENIIDVGLAENTREVVYFDKNKDEQFIMKPDATGKLVRTPYSGRMDKTTSKVSATATSTTSGIKEFKDIPDLRSKIVSVVDPFRKAVNATDMALESLDLSITQNNFAGFNAARVQLAKALSGGDLSQKEIAAAGGDPSILGGLIDTTSTLFTSTPSIPTQQKIKDTIKAIRKVALKKGRDEISAQRNIASRSGFNKDDFEAASDIPEFRAGKAKKTITLKSGKTVTVQED